MVAGQGGGQPITVKHYVVSSDGNYAAAIVGAPGLDSVTAYFSMSSGTWKMTTIGSAEITAESAKMSVNTFNSLTNELNGTSGVDYEAQNANESTPVPAPAGASIDGLEKVPSGVATTLTSYFSAINGGDYATAYSLLGPQEQANQNESQFATGIATTQDSNISIPSWPTSTGTNTYMVDVSFNSHQSASQGPNGDICDNWTLEYTMVNSGGSWLINGVSGQNRSTHSACG
jgi:hypothetical protein